MAKLRVKDYMTKNVVTLSPENTVEDAIRLIEETGHDGFPVVDEDGMLVGYVSSIDLLKKDPTMKIKDIMKKEVHVAKEYMPLKDVARVMFRTGHSKLPVVDDRGRLVGIISNTDVIRSQIERATPEKVEKLKKTLEKIHNTNITIERGKVEVSKLIPTQTKVYADELRGRIHELRKGLAEPIVVIRKDNRYYLVDGHHRAIASLKIGQKLLDAYILNVPENVELGIEKLVRRKGIKSLKDVEVVDEGHPLVEITLKRVE
ncbi:CBS domain-containing ParB/RepB/Spo0J family partition protein [Archaeoglobus profundus]|uniref:CBS domain containing membrane protein n=1 Tax=Archaeoglobus profundus (strain DSM 5631 / JCM 9629 / NBRC 100127 / Av18) TaxID=572546 RepID=D2RE03_ARCPA|nr:CBS domain-containing protein [Archaeoglobus profundus]ADB58347.1 CBS domain containing membrane protein [Archaeoglobus profundus DSM 5631]